MSTTTELSHRDAATPVAQNYIQAQPTTKQYYIKGIATAVGGVSLINQFALTNYWISTQPIEDARKWVWSKLPFASAQEVPPVQPIATAQPVVVTTPPVAQPVVIAETAQATATATTTTWGTFFSDKWTSFKNAGSTVTTPIGNFVSAHKELIGRVSLIAGFAGTYLAVNHIASKRITDPSWRGVAARGILSFGTATVVVWTASNFVVGHSIKPQDVMNIGVQMLVSSAVLKVAAPLIQKGLAKTHYLANALKWDISYPVATKEKSA